MKTLTPRKKAEAKLVKSALSYAAGTLEFSDEEVGSALGASARTISRWRKQDTLPAGESVMAAERLLSLAHALDDVFGDDKDALHEWLHERVPALARRTPLRAIIDGDIDQVLKVVANADGGVFL